MSKTEERVPGTAEDSRPWFIWDYRVTKRQFREYLKERGTFNRRWALRRLLSRVNPPEIWEYVGLDDLIEALRDPELSLRPWDRDLWEAAVESWTRERQGEATT